MPRKDAAMRIHRLCGRTAIMDIKVYRSRDGLEACPSLMIKSKKTRQRYRLPRTSELPSESFSNYHEFLEVGLGQMKELLTKFESTVRMLKKQKHQMLPTLPMPQDSEMDQGYGNVV